MPIIALVAWIVIIFLLAGFAWFATRKANISAAVLVIVGFPLLYVMHAASSGSRSEPCDPVAPPRKVLGYKIDFDLVLGVPSNEQKGTIFLLLDDKYPLYCHMPYSDLTAESLQQGTTSPEGIPGDLTFGGDGLGHVEFPSGNATKDR